MNEPGGPRADVLLWGVIAAWTAVTLASFFAPAVLSPNHARYVNVALMSVFTLLHGARRYGWAGIGVYFAIACLVANGFENLSITTGLPFGQYHHTAAMGPKLFQVPLIIGPIFAVAGYLAWVVTGILLGAVFGAPEHGLAVARCVLAAAVTTMWDLCVDAIGGTVNRDWIWAHGGAFFGVPWLNFAGWLLTMWVIFQLFAGYVTRVGQVRPVPVASPYWLQPVVFWLLIALQFPLLALIVPEAAITDAAGATWSMHGLFTSMAVVSVFTMGFTGLLAWVLLARARAGH